MKPERKRQTIPILSCISPSRRSTCRPNIDVHSPEVYEKAKENLQSFIEKGILVEEDKPCYYIYRLVMNGKSQTGLVAGSSVDDYEKGIIRKHELTRPEKENDRINHMKAIRAQTGNVFLAYKGVAAIDGLIEEWKDGHAPLYDFVAVDGIGHTIWRVDDEKTIATISGLFARDVPFTYIADGHHRAASAAKVRKALGIERFNGIRLFPDNACSLPPSCISWIITGWSTI